MGAKMSKRYSYKSQPKVFTLFLSFFENFKFTIVDYGGIKNINYLQNEPL